MKKIKAALLFMLLLTMLSATALAGTMYVNRAKQKSIKMYNANNEVICTIPYRAAVETHSRSRIDDERMEVGYKDHWGWVYSRYLSSTKPPKAEESSKKDSSKKESTDKKPEEVNVFAGMKSVEHYVVVVRPSTPTGYVNLRWAPSKNAKVRAIRYNSDVLRVIAENKTWAQVMDDVTGECGFMMKSFLERVDDVG